MTVNPDSLPCQLIRVKLFRAASKLVALQLFDDQAEAFDFAITMLKFTRHIAHQAMQLLCIRW